MPTVKYGLDSIRNLLSNFGIDYDPILWEANLSDIGCVVEEADDDLLLYWKEVVLKYSLEKTMEMIQNMEALDEWIRFHNIIEKFNTLGMKDYTEKIPSTSWDAMEGKVECDELVDVYKNFELKMSGEYAANSVDFLERLLAEQDIKLRVAERELTEYKLSLIHI